jgi:hypothetical protein
MFLRKSNAILEYGVIIAIVIAALAAMHHVIRRGSQANIKRISDAAIGDYSDERVGKEGGDERHEKLDTASSLKLENLGGNTLTYNRDNNAFFNYDIPAESSRGTVRDVVDYAIKPPVFNYPSTVYLFWDMRWPLEERQS